MSHKATNWAIQQRGLSPSAKLVLWHLCDRHHPDNGCFPSQTTLADDCELSRSGLNNQLDALEGAGLIRRERRRDEATNRQENTRYRFAFEPDFAAEDQAEPCPKSGHGNEGEPCPKNPPSRVQTVGHEPVSEPVSLRESARETEEAFEQARRDWPSGFADSREDALAAWRQLSVGERREAVLEIDRFYNTTKAIGRKHICGFAAYLREKRWMALPERPRSATVPSAVPTERQTAPRAAPTAFQRANPHLYPELFGPDEVAA